MEVTFWIPDISYGRTQKSSGLQCHRREFENDHIARGWCGKEEVLENVIKMGLVFRKEMGAVESSRHQTCSHNIALHNGER